MKKYLVVAFIMVCAWVSGRANLAYVNYANGKYTFNVVLDASDKNKSVTLELSMYEDFSRIRTAEIKASDPNAGENRSISISETAADEGDYYWRMRVHSSENKYSWIYPLQSEMNPIRFTKKPAEYVIKKDESVFDQASFDDGTKLNLSSVWLRCHLLGNHTYICVDKSVYGDYKRQITYNHGFFVKDGVIYLCRGSLRAAGWDSDASRVWLLRYDLATGAELPMLWVYAPGSVDYPYHQMMPWVRVDDDGTPYFTSYAYGNKATLYAIDLDDITSDAHSVTAKEIVTVTMKNGIMPEYITVKGSINSGTFEMWGATDNDAANIYDANLSWQVVRWKVSESGSEEEVSDIKTLGFVTESKKADSYSMMVYPIGDDYFYMHGYYLAEYESLSPSLYRFNSGAACELLDHYLPEGDYPVIVTPKMGGVAMPVVEDKQLLVYGVNAQGRSTASAAQISYVPSLTGDFTDHVPLWQLGGATGFSENLIQGVDAKYFPDETEHTGGILVVYFGNGALGVYRVDVTSPTVSVDAIAVSPITVSYDGASVIVNRKVAGLSLYDMQGRRVASVSGESDRLITGSLSKGVYIVNADNNQLNLKLIVN